MCYFSDVHKMWNCRSKILICSHFSGPLLLQAANTLQQKLESQVSIFATMVKNEEKCGKSLNLSEPNAVNCTVQYVLTSAHFTVCRKCKDSFTHFICRDTANARAL